MKNKSQSQLDRGLSKTLKRVLSSYLFYFLVLLPIATFAGRKIAYFYLLKKEPQMLEVIEEFIPPEKPCDPPREPKVMLAKPSGDYSAVEPATPIEVYFNENMDPTSLNSENIQICVRIFPTAGTSRFREDDVEKIKENSNCADIERYGIYPFFDYLKESMKLTITPSENEKWGSSDEKFTMWIEVTVTSKVKSICGLTIKEPYNWMFPLEPMEE